MPKAYSGHHLPFDQKSGRGRRLCENCGACDQGSGRRFIVRGMPAHTFEQGLKERTVVIEFDSLEKALAARDAWLPRGPQGARQ